MWKCENVEMWKYENMKMKETTTIPLDELIAFLNGIEVHALTTHDRTLIKLALDKKSQEIGRLNSVELSILKR